MLQFIYTRKTYVFDLHKQFTGLNFFGDCIRKLLTLVAHKKMMYRKLIHYALSPWFVALITAIIFALLVPLAISKFDTVLLNKIKTTNTQLYLSHDFNHDQHSEKIQISLNIPDGTPHIVFRNHLDQLLLQWNLKGDFIKRSKPVFGDYDRNGNDELYITTFANNMLAINAYEPTVSNGLKIKHREICRLETYNGEQDWRVAAAGVHDLNGDDYGELLLSVCSGFTLQPRALFAWDIRNDSIFRSPASGSAFIKRLSVIRLPDNGETLITGTITSTNNYAEHHENNIPREDSCSWLMVFNGNLEYLFEPVPFPGHPTEVWPEFVTCDNSVKILVKTVNTGIPDYPDFLALYNLKGEKMKERVFEHLKQRVASLQGIGEGPPFNEIVTISRNNKIGRLRSDLTFEMDDLPGHPGRMIDQQVDLNNDGMYDLILMDKTHSKISIYPDGFHHPVNIDLGPDSFDSHTGIISVKHNGDAKPEIWISWPENMMVFKVSENPLFPWRHLYYLLVYIAFLAFIFLIQKLYVIRKKRMEELKQKMILLELKSIKNRMSPHFIFNVMSTLSNQVLKGDKMDAYDSITKFSGLLRETFESSDKHAIQLKDELSLVEKFVHLQWLRFSGKFDFNIHVDDNVNLAQIIPKFAVWTYVENAIKHGIFHKKEGGMLLVKISADKGYTMIEVDDNGIGRRAAAALSGRRKGLGLSIMHEYFAVFNRNNLRKLTYEIIDKYDEWKEPAGTLVRIRIPVGYNTSVGVKMDQEN